jgi:thymidine kinase
MFSGKTEELLRRLRRAIIAHQNIAIYKPVTDTRYHFERVVSHDENSIQSVSVDHSEAILNNGMDVRVIGIDEAQFFDDKLPEVCQKLALRGVRVIVSGLDMDFRGEPFGPIPALLAMSEYVTKLHAICPHCGNLATHSYRLSDEDETVLVGEKDKYEPRCRICYQMGNILDFRPRT